MMLCLWSTMLHCALVIEGGSHVIYSHHKKKSNKKFKKLKLFLYFIEVKMALHPHDNASN